MARQVRSDSTIETFAKRNNLPLDIFRNENGRKIRKDKTIRSVRKEAKKRGMS